MTLVVEPGKGIGPLRLGMTRSEALLALQRLDLPFEEYQRRGGDVSLQVAGQLNAHFDANDCIQELEAATARESHDQRLRLGDIDLQQPAPRVAALVDALAEPNRLDREFPAGRDYPSIGLSLWQDAKPGELRDEPFEAVLVRAPSHEIPVPER